MHSGIANGELIYDAITSAVLLDFYLIAEKPDLRRKWGQRRRGPMRFRPWQSRASPATKLFSLVCPAVHMECSIFSYLRDPSFQAKLHSSHPEHQIGPDISNMLAFVWKHVDLVMSRTVRHKTVLDPNAQDFQDSVLHACSRFCFPSHLFSFLQEFEFNPGHGGKLRGGPGVHHRTHHICDLPEFGGRTELQR